MDINIRKGWNRSRCLGKDGAIVYFQAEFPFSQGHFYLRAFSNGTCTYTAHVNPPGLDLQGLLDLGARIASEIYTLTGKHVNLQELIESPPRRGCLLRISGYYKPAELEKNVWRPLE